MADLTITAANVLKSATGKVKQGVCGTTALAQGKPVYKDATTGKLELARANAAGTYIADGVTLNAASPNQPVSYTEFDPAFVPGATLIKGVTYVVSAAVAGAIAPQDDLTTGNFTCVLGIATSTTTLKLDLVDPLTTTAIA